jgi:hypothetical protein
MHFLYSVGKVTKGRSSRQTPFTIKPKKLALKDQLLTPPKYFSNKKNKNPFCIKQLFRAHENMKKQPSKVAHSSQPAIFFITGLAAQKAHLRQK